MPEAAARPLNCRNCHTAFERPKLTGRPPSYCSTSCRKAAYRRRQQPTTRRSSAAHDADVKQIAETLQNKASTALQLSKRPLPARPLDLVAEVRRMERDLNDLKAVAVRQAHEMGALWYEIGKVLSLDPGTARNRFSNEKVARAVAIRSSLGAGPMPQPAVRAPTLSRGDSRPAADDTPPPDASLPGHPGYQLSTALSHLQRSAGMTGRTLAARLGISPSLLSRILLGKRPPKWRVVKEFAELCGADPDDLRPLYEKAQGLRVVPPPSPEDYPRTARAMQTTLRGMRLAAGYPDTDTLCRNGRFTPEQITGALESDDPATHLADWSFVARLAAALRGSPDDLRALWEQMNAARSLAAPPLRPSSPPPTAPRPAGAREGSRPTPVNDLSTRTAVGWAVPAGQPRSGPGRWDWVLRTMEVLHTLGQASSPLTDTDLASSAGLLPSSVRELLVWLTHSGLARELNDGTYLAGPLLTAIRRGHDVPSWLLAQLSADTHAAVYLGEYVDGELEATRSWHRPDTPPVHEYVPFRVTAHANALGKAALAQLNSKQRKEHLNRHKLIELTASTITDLPKLERSLTTTGQRPVYYDRQEYNDTENCAAVSLALPGRNGCVGLSLPPSAHSRIGATSRLLSGRSTKALLSLVLTLTLQTGTPTGDSTPTQPVNLPHAVPPPPLRTITGDLLAA